MKKLLIRFSARIFAVLAVLTARTFNLEYSYNKPDELIHQTDSNEIKDSDY